MKFNERLLELRKKSGWSQEELGYKIDVSRQTISKWESGQTTPELEKLRMLAKLFEISVDELIRDDDTEENEVKVDNNNKKKKGIKRRIALIIFIMMILVYIAVFAYRLIIIWNTEAKMTYTASVAIYNNSVITEENTLDGKIKTYQLYTDLNSDLDKDIVKLKKSVYLINDLGSPLEEQYIIQKRIESSEKGFIYEYETYDINNTNQTYSYNKKEATEEESDIDIYSVGNDVYNILFNEWKKSYNTVFLKNKILMAADLRINIRKTKDGYLISNYNMNAPKNKETNTIVFDEENGEVVLILTKYDENIPGSEYKITYTIKSPISFNGGITNFNSKELPGPTKPSYVEIPDLSEYTLIEI